MGESRTRRARCSDTRLTVEDCLSLPISMLRNHGLLSDGLAGQRFTWRDEQGEVAASINVLVDMAGEPCPTARFQYTVEIDGVRREVDLRMTLTQTPTRNGGRRWWYTRTSGA